MKFQVPRYMYKGLKVFIFWISPISMLNCFLLLIGRETAPCEGEVTFQICESKDYKYAKCSIPESRTITSAIVFDQRSDSACDFYNSTLPEDYNGPGRYGFKNNVLWVHGGCRAEFEICSVGK